MRIYIYLFDFCLRNQFSNIWEISQIAQISKKNFEQWHWYLKGKFTTPQIKVQKADSTKCWVIVSFHDLLRFSICLRRETSLCFSPFQLSPSLFLILTWHPAKLSDWKLGFGGLPLTLLGFFYYPVPSFSVFIYAGNFCTKY